MTVTRPAPAPARSSRAAARSAAALVAAAMLSGCSLVGLGSTGPSPPERLDRGVAEMEAGDYRTAYEAVETVADSCGDRPLGQQALLLQAAMDLDPRVPFGDPQRAADRLAHLLLLADRPRWTGPLAESLYVLALEMGAEPAVRAAAAEAAGRRPGTAGEDGRGPSPGPAVGDEAGDGEPSPASREGELGYAAGPDCGALDWSADAPAAVGVLPRLPGASLARRNAYLRERVAELEEELERLRALLEPPR